MWKLEAVKPVKLIVGVLAADEPCLDAARRAVGEQFGRIDLASDVWPFTQTDYYRDEMGEHILRQFVTFDKLIDPGELAAIKHATNRIEQDLAGRLGLSLPRPVNLDPGVIEPGKLVLASTKNFAHRIYIGQGMYAEVTLTFANGVWHSHAFTFPDYRQACYHEFFSRVRTRLVEQRRQQDSRPEKTS